MCALALCAHAHSAVAGATRQTTMVTTTEVYIPISAYLLRGIRLRGMALHLYGRRTSNLGQA